MGSTWVQCHTIVEDGSKQPSDTLCNSVMSLNTAEGEQAWCMQVAHVATEEGITEAEMLQLSACLEKSSSHPLAAVVLGRAAAMHLPLDAEVTSSHIMPGDPSQMFTLSQKYCTALAFNNSLGKAPHMSVTPFVSMQSRKASCVAKSVAMLQVWVWQAL